MNLTPVILDRLVSLCVVVAFALLALFVLEGCAPTPFKDGPAVTAPPGCVAGRERGVDC